MDKKRFWLWSAAIILGLLLVVGPLAAQSSTIVLRRYTFGSGGGAASSGSLVLNGTIGQPSPAGPLQSGNLVLRAGFWHGQPGDPTAVRLVLQSAESAGMGRLPLALLGLALFACLALTWQTVARQRGANLWRNV
jgi:hypothetical protein